MADPREGPGEPGPPIIFRPNRDPKGRKNFFWRRPPAPSKGLDDLDRLPLSQGLDLARLLACEQAFNRAGS